MTQPVRVLHLITGLNRGGAELALARLMETMDAQKFESRVVSMITPGPVGDRIRAQGFKVDSLEMPPGRATFSGFFRLIQLIREYRPQILQTWLYHADLLGLVSGKIMGVPSIVWNIRGSEMNFMASKRISAIVAKTCAVLSGWPKAVIVNSRAGLKAHENLGYTPRRWCFIPNGIDINRFHPHNPEGNKLRAHWGIADNIDIIGMVARIDPQKDYLNFLRAADLVCRNKPNVRFVCVGSGTMEYVNELKAFVKALRLEDRVLWAGSIENMPAVYNAFDVAVSASAYGEGFPNVVAEAMACGLPCIVTRTGDSPDLIGNAGEIVPPQDHLALADAIIRILDTPIQQRKDLGIQARERIVSNFSLDKMTQEYTDLYQQLI